MSNLRRHFNFSTKSSQQDIPFGSSSSTKTSYNHFDKHVLMNDICNCLELCCTYIQTLNALCSAGSSLAKKFFQAVQEVPAYHNISQQFLSIWEEVSKATAGASAAVKTETLMMLQEIFNTLEMQNDADMNDTISESFQVVGMCLCSFIELQAQFSWSTWKSLSKLSKSFTPDLFRHTLQWKSHDRTSFKICVNSDLNATIKKHFSQLFCKVGISKANDSTESNQEEFSTPSQENSFLSAYSSFPSHGVENMVQQPTWSSSSSIWSSPEHITKHISSQPEHPIQDVQNLPVVVNSELEEVINLLSCVPVQHSQSEINQNVLPYSKDDEQSFNVWTKNQICPLPRHQLDGGWSKESNTAFQYDSRIWSIDSMNNPDLPNVHMPNVMCKQNSGNNEIYFQNREIQKWNLGTYETESSSDDASSVHGHDSEMPLRINEFGKHLLSSMAHRWCNTRDSLPNGLKDVYETREDRRLSKISTWPLKQTANRHSENNSDFSLS